MEQKMTMVIRAVQNLCTYYIKARSHRRRLGEGIGVGAEVAATSFLSQTVMMKRAESTLSICLYVNIQLPENRFQLQNNRVAFIRKSANMNI
jgi:hypothetical protein